VPLHPNALNDLDDIKEYFDDSPDRGIAISLPAILDNRVTSILKAIMLPDERILNELFSPNRALGSFKAKVDLIYLLGLIDKEFYQDLTVINKIRNRFAHDVAIKELEKHPIGTWIKDMGVYRGLVAMRDRPNDPSDTPEAKAANFAKALMTVELDTMRNGFRNCIRFMIVRLNEIEQTLLAHKEAHLKARAAQAKKSSDGG